MTDLPDGWAKTTLGEVGRYLNGRGFKQSEWAESGRPIIRIQNLTRSGASHNYFSGPIEERYVVRRGDLLISWAATLGAFLWQGPEAVLNQHIFKVQSFIDRRFHYYLVMYLLSDLVGETHGSGIVHVTRARFDSLPVDLPPVAEQRRIVAVLDVYFSRLDAGVKLLTKQLLRLRALKKRLLVESVPVGDETGWRTVTVAEAGRVDLGRQRHPDWHTGDHMRPYLRVANVFEDRIDTTDVMEMDFPPAVFEKFKLVPGDILLNEGQSPELLGRPALYRGVPEDVAFTNSLLRFRVGPDVDPEWALLVFRRHMHAGRFSREVRITTNIAHLSATRFKAVEFPIPPLTEQREIVARTADRLAGVERLIAEVEHAARKSDALRASLLAEAFAGRLVPQDPDDEPAAELLARIRAERSATIPKQRTRSRRTPKELAAPPTRVTGDDYQQETLPL
ncbi:restriction endonuclease subunit S [Micromonospora sp. WMMD734]|uniref:restriction endonuclease subunit S n=1 Tax=Micromonospora sp. WMMD734 TaxID=3404129 RepID=UPI003B929548